MEGGLIDELIVVLLVAKIVLLLLTLGTKIYLNCQLAEKACVAAVDVSLVSTAWVCLFLTIVGDSSVHTEFATAEA